MMENDTASGPFKVLVGMVLVGNNVLDIDGEFSEMVLGFQLVFSMYGNGLLVRPFIIFFKFA